MGNKYKRRIKKYQAKKKEKISLENLANLMFGNFKGLAEQQSITQAVCNAFSEVLKRHFPDFETDVQVVLDRYMAESEERRAKEAEEKAKAEAAETDGLPPMSAELAEEIASHNNAIDLAKAMTEEAEEE